MKYCVVNADDFGLSPGINRGILEAHRAGIVTSTSLMVNTPGSAEAASVSRSFPNLSLGLHVNLTNESPDPAAALSAWKDFSAELENQFRRFCELIGCLPTHLDAHQNVQRDPRVLPFLLDLARRHRLPLREHSRVRYFPSFYGQWDDGETHLEQISVESLLRMLETEFGDGFTELSCHPGYVDPNFQSFYRWEREAELKTLCDPRVRARLQGLDIRLVSFRDLAKAGEALC
ncbi:MAG: ChbG/HpnK family deacetylase [Acidobacteria bacterium]|nr:MAG: ChbG/HpnK family deacetylase [Acidobacteriota bacterium]